MRLSPRLRRLRSDWKAMQRLRAESDILDFTTFEPTLGDVPEVYLVRFRGRGLWKPVGAADVQIAPHHEVAIRLGASYPRLIPELAWKSPVFHPNIASNGVVCLGGYSTHWVPSLQLDDLCAMLWDMVRYRNYDVDSPYNRAAAEWARSQPPAAFPIDPRPLRNLAMAKPGHAAPAWPRPAASVVPADIAFVDAEVIDAELVVEQNGIETSEILYIE